MLSKRQFCNAINALKSNDDFICELNELLGRYQMDVDIVGTRVEDALITVLQIIFKDESEWISYWCHELNFGELYKEGDVVDRNGQNIPLKTAEDLYNLLIDDYFNSVSDTNGDYEVIMTCAVRYCLGRRTYMPSLIVSYITPMISKLSDRTLECIKRDIEQAERDNMLGDESIDKPLWLIFLHNIKKEIKNRE